jgi:hypothetical protein
VITSTLNVERQQIHSVTLALLFEQMIGELKCSYGNNHEKTETLNTFEGYQVGKEKVSPLR